MKRFNFVIVGRANAKDKLELGSWLEGQFKKEGKYQGLNIQLIMIEEK